MTLKVCCPCAAAGRSAMGSIPTTVCVTASVAEICMPIAFERRDHGIEIARAVAVDLDAHARALDLDQV